MKRPIHVLKVGGNELDNADFMAGLGQIVRQWRQAGRDVVIVHGGGKKVQAWQMQFGLRSRYVEGLRVTDDVSIEIVEAVLSGLINKHIVARLLQAGIPAIGLSGVDNRLISVRKMVHVRGDLGWVGEIVAVEPAVLHQMLTAGLTPVVSPVSIGPAGHSYNVNADHAARAVAVALDAARVTFLTNVPGLRIAGEILPTVTVGQVEGWIETGEISGGMIPKVRSAVAAVQGGVLQAMIANSDGIFADRGTLITEMSGHSAAGPAI